MFESNKLSLYIPLFIIISLGLLLHHSFGISYFYLQLGHICLGLILFFILQKIDFSFFYLFRWQLYFLALIFLILTLIIGTATRGSVRWIDIFGLFRFQPSEFSKPLLIVSFAAALAATDLSKITTIIKLLIIYLLPVGLIFLQPDFGSAIIIVAILLGMLFASGIRYRHQFLLTLTGLVLTPVVWLFLKDYQRHRLFTFLNPLSDPMGKGYNSIQAIIAIGSGQLLGRGLGHGTQSKLRFLPENRTDFIFASLAEELGLLGSVILILTFSWLVLELFHRCSKQSSLFGYLIIFGVGVFFASQAFINIGMNLGLLPITGITLPLVSAGGSSIVTSFISLGIVSALQNRQITSSIEIR